MFGSGLVRLLSATPAHPVGPDGKMALSDHFREFRARILRAVLVVLLGFVAGLFLFDHLYTVVNWPYAEAARNLPPGTTEPITRGAAAGLMLRLQLAFIGSLVVTSPFWLYQLWAFLVPGLKRSEKKWTAVFVVIAGPLFLAGIVLGYLTLPLGLEMLIKLNPDDRLNQVDFNEYFVFFTRTLLAFGISFEIPVFVVLLNFAGVVKGRALATHRHWIIIGTFVFAAVATPSGDPFTMSLMAGPMVILFFISEVIARLNDKRRARKSPNAGLSPDEASVI